MPINCEEKLSVKLVRQEKGWGVKRICKEFSNKKWAVSSVKDLLQKIDKTNSIECKAGSGRPRTVKTEQNVERVAELISSQEGNPGSSRSTREIEHLTGISRSSVRWIAKRNLQLRVFRHKKVHLLFDSDREKRVKCCKTLLCRRCLQNVDKIWFSDEKIFYRSATN